MEEREHVLVEIGNAYTKKIAVREIEKKLNERVKEAKAKAKERHKKWLKSPKDKINSEKNG